MGCFAQLRLTFSLLNMHTCSTGYSPLWKFSRALNFVCEMGSDRKQSKFRKCNWWFCINSINIEKLICREVLKITLDAILFHAKNNFALRGSNKIIGDPDYSIFLFEFASHYNTNLKEHIWKHQKVPFLVSHHYSKWNNKISWGQN